MTARHPIQPLLTDEHGVLRFKQNAIVRYLLDKGPFDLNHLAACDFAQEDEEQFAQLIGYSLNGFSELSYVRDDTYAAASQMAEGKTETQARIDSLQKTLDEAREALRKLVPILLRVHPDDLEA